MPHEEAGRGANLIGGWLATRFGIARMLAIGWVLTLALPRAAEPRAATAQAPAAPPARAAEPRKTAAP